MTKKLMLFIAAMIMTTLTIQANQEPIKAEFTVTQVALDAEKAQASTEEATEEDKNSSTEETQPEGGEPKDI